MHLPSLRAYEEGFERSGLEPGIVERVRAGAGALATVHENLAGFRRLRFIARVLVDVSEVRTSVQVLGQPISFPVIISPVGAQVWVSPQAELPAAIAAMRAGTIFTRPFAATVSIEQISALGPARRWQQCELLADRGQMRDLAAKAAANGFEAICLTVDRARKARRPADLLYPRPPGSPVLPTTDSSFGWRDLAQLVATVELPVVVKGINHSSDAIRAVQCGVKVIVVSNHGGNQLDSCAATIDLLPDIADAVGGEADVLLDGGIRSGQDVVKALALGARAVGIGRPVMWGAAHAGADGVSDVLKILQLELTETLALLGVPAASCVPAEVLFRPAARP
jgi:4-hydroxymandelate oxidase